MSNPHTPLDTDMLDVTAVDRAYAEGFADGWDSTKTKPRDRVALVAVVAAGLAVLLAGIVVGHAIAAPRSAQLAIPVAVETVASGTDAGQSGAPRLLSADAPPSGGRNLALGAPLPSEPIVTEPPAIAAGLASWYDDGPGLYGAVPSWRFGDEPYEVRVSAGGRSVVVTVRDFCGCPGDRIIDLSPEAFRRLAPLSRGVIPVTVEDVGPALTAPPTDVGP